LRLAGAFAMLLLLCIQRWFVSEVFWIAEIILVYQIPDFSGEGGEISVFDVMLWNVSQGIHEGVTYRYSECIVFMIKKETYLKSCHLVFSNV
jgi:hypothetical protein